jgi:formylglycine-generating enzyme
MPRLLCALLSLLAASSASAVTMAWTPIGNPGNPADTRQMLDGTTGYGSVPYDYHIATYEVTNAQYVEFLNAKAAADPLGLYNPSMPITRSGSSGSYTYTVINAEPIGGINWVDRAVKAVSFYDALRFANWLHNGQGTSDTETGSYTLLGGTATPSNGTTVARNANATVVIPTENEWYKAAYYDSDSTSYFSYPTGSHGTFCSNPTADPNRANCRIDPTGPSPHWAVGSYPGSPSPYGTFDQGGSVWEWNESTGSADNFGDSPCLSTPELCRGLRGDGYLGNGNYMDAAGRNHGLATAESTQVGFRLAYIPEPGTGLLVIVGIVSLAGWRRGHR